MAINKNKVLANAQRYAEKGAYDKAIAEYLKVVKEDPEDVRAWLKLGDLYAKKGSRKEATATYLKVAEFYAGQGFYLKAVAVYKQILKLDPTVIQVNLRLAELYQQLGLLSDAQSQYEHVSAYFQRSGQVRESLEVMQKLVDLDPDNVPSRIKLAELYSKSNLKDDAVREFGFAAEKLRGQGRIDDFIKVAERLLWHKPNELGLTRELANIYLERGDTKRALAKLQQCFQVDPRDVETLSLLATAFQSIGQIPKTISVYKEMVRIFGERGDEHSRREVLEAIITLAPDDQEARTALYGNQAPSVSAVPPDVYGMQSDDPAFDHYPTNDAVSFGAHEVEPFPDNRDDIYHNHLAHQEQFGNYRGQGNVVPHVNPAINYTFEDEDDLPTVDSMDDVEEIDEFEEIEELDSFEEFEEVVVVENKGYDEEIRRLLSETEVFIKYGLYDKALNHFQKIFELQPLHIEAHERLKDLYIQLGDIDRAVLELIYLADIYIDSDNEGALYYLQLVTQLVPDHPEAVERMLQLGIDATHTHSENPNPDFESLSPSQNPYAEASDLVFSVDDDLVSNYPEPMAGIAYPNGTGGVLSHEPVHLPDSDESTVDNSEEDDDVALSAASNTIAALEEELEEVEFFLQQGLTDEARNMLYELSQNFPGNRLVLEKLSELDGQSGAEDLFDQSFDLGSQIPNELNDAQDYHGGSSTNGEVKDVFEQFKQGVAQQVDAGDADTHFDLGVAYKEMGLVEDAVAEFEMARENPEREAIAQTMIGHCFAQVGQMTEAINAYKRGLYAERKTSAEELELYYALGTTYIALSDPKEAYYYFQKVAKREPNFRDVQEKIGSIQSGNPGVVD